VQAKVVEIGDISVFKSGILSLPVFEITSSEVMLPCLPHLVHTETLIDRYETLRTLFVPFPT